MVDHEVSSSVPVAVADGSVIIGSVEYWSVQTNRRKEISYQKSSTLEP